MSKLLNITTDVGGRPGSSREPEGVKISTGIDYILAKAALNDIFKKELVEDPLECCIWTFKEKERWLI